MQTEKLKACNDLHNAEMLVKGQTAKLCFRGTVQPDNIDDLIHTKELIFIYQRQIENGLSCLLEKSFLPVIKEVVKDLDFIILTRNTMAAPCTEKSTVMYHNMITYNDWPLEKLKDQALSMRKNIKLISEDLECMALLFAVEKRLLDFIF